ncbi:MAG: hypothetical protein RL291_169, partial [Pseudomonadota bacterium]
LADVAKIHEPDRYASALLVSNEAQRDGLLAIAAFAAELRRIPLAVKEPMMGEIRLQWWRDAIAAPTPASPEHAEGAAAHPVAAALLKAAAKFNLPSALLAAMTEARSFDLYPDTMPDEATLDAYLMKTEGIVFDLSARVLGQSSPSQSLLTTASRAYGLSRLAMELPHALARGRLPLPAPRLEACGIDIDALLRGEHSTAVDKLRDSLLNDVRTAYDAAKPQVAALPRDARAAFLPLALVPSSIKRLEASGNAWLSQPPVLTPFGRYWRLWRAYRSGVI